MGKARPLAERIAEAEANASTALGNYNEAVALGRTARAERELARSQWWLDEANRLRGWDDGAMPKTRQNA